MEEFDDVGDIYDTGDTYDPDDVDQVVSDIKNIGWHLDFFYSVRSTPY